MASSIDRILYPKPLLTLRHSTPVKCLVWNGADYTTIMLDVIYPFDTIDMIKYLIYNHFKKAEYLPRFLFVGIPQETGTEPSPQTKYIPIDFLWYPSGANKETDTIQLSNPMIYYSDQRFVTRDGSFANPEFVYRGRSTIEDVFLRHGGKIPELHVYPLTYLLPKGTVTDEIWNGQFAGFFPKVLIRSTYQPDDNDRKFGKTLQLHIGKRKKTMHVVEQLIRHTGDLVHAKVDSIQQFKLIWKKPIAGFEGCASMFYQIPVTRNRPYIRLYPSDSDPITKIHVQGVLPIPTLDDPRLLEVWTKDSSVTPEKDMCTIKYVHRPILGISQTIYGTIHVLNDGTMTLLVQPPQKVDKLDPVIDFRNTTRVLENIFTDLPQPLFDFEVKEVAMRLLFNVGDGPNFSVNRLKKRLPYFSYVMKEIQKLPDSNALMVLRYTAVSQYKSENQIDAFISQLVTEQKIQGEMLIRLVIQQLEEEFLLSEQEAKEIVTKYLQQKDHVIVQVPEEGEITETNNSGIDIHIYSHHPYYECQINRINSLEALERIYTLLSILFIENDNYFTDTLDSRYAADLGRIVEDEEYKMSRVADTRISNTMKQHNTASVVSEPNDQEYEEVDYDPFAVESDMAAAAAAAPVAAAPAAAVASKAPKAPITYSTQQKNVNPERWFINKLKEIDAGLFSTKGYSTKCQSAQSRQPVILTKQQYKRMRNVYEEDNIFFIEYPVTDDNQIIEPIDTEETVIVMKFGSSGKSINYMFCPEFFCLSDEIMVRRQDFLSTFDRDNKRKPEQTCPFCKGGLITHDKGIVPGRTVVQRIADGKYYPYIDFLKRTSHPDGIALPCCFLKKPLADDHLRIKDERFAFIRKYLIDVNIAAVQEEIEQDDDDMYDYTEAILDGTNAIDYLTLIHIVYTRNINESNKTPLPGVFAIAPPHFDDFFTQNSTNDIVERVTANLRLKPNAIGFIRIGTHNTPFESLLGVLAPVIEVNSIDAVRERLHNVILPRIFMNAHFGNLVLEFYDPSDKTAMPKTYQDLKKWVEKDYLEGLTLNSENTYELTRIHNAYERFRRFLFDPTQRKDLRHIQPLLAEPGLLTTNGVQLIIMEDNNGEIIMKCPIFGVSERHLQNDFVFISKSVRKLGKTTDEYNHYELYIHTGNQRAHDGEVAVHEPIKEWNIKYRDIWPPIVAARIDEYMTNCKSRYRSIYTSQTDIDSNKVIPLSYITSALIVSGIIKDAYNHIVAALVRLNVPKKSPKDKYPIFALPIVDDGAISISTSFAIKTIYFSWESYDSRPIEEVVAFYKTTIVPAFPLYSGYDVESIVKKRRSDIIIAIQLKNGLYVPVAPPENMDELNKFQLPTVEIEEFQWEIDKRMDGIVEASASNWDSFLEDTTTERRCRFDKELEMMTQSNYSDFEELYQQFRYTVSNYIVQTLNVKADIEAIIFNMNLPSYEKRKRLFIYFGSLLLTWFYPDSEWERSTSFVRKDCSVSLTPESCTGTCKWKSMEDEKDPDAGTCLLHVKDKISLDGTSNRMVNTPELFTKRVIDELVYFSHLRNQLMTSGEISRVSKLVKPIRMNDQYIIPEESISWVNMLRLEWLKDKSDKPKYYEEMSRETDEKISEETLPQEIKAVIGDAPLELYIPPNQDPDKPFVSFQGILNVDLDKIGMNETSLIMDDTNLTKYTNVTGLPIGFINEGRFEFARPDKGSFTSILVFVRVGSSVGILIENEGNSTVSVGLLPEPTTIYIVKKKKKQYKPLIDGDQEELPQLPLVGTDLVQKPLPPIATAAKKPIVRDEPAKPTKIKPIV